MDTQSSMAHRLLGAAPGQDVSFEAFRQGQTELSEMTVLMALEYVKSRRAAERIYQAEIAGLMRQKVIASAGRRLDDFDRWSVRHGEMRSVTKEVATE